MGYVICDYGCLFVGELVGEVCFCGFIVGCLKCGG